MKPGNNEYRLLECLPDAFAYCQIVTDHSGKPVDCIFLNINPAFEEMTDLAREEVIGRKVTGVLPGTKNADFDWIGTYGRVALDGETASFEQYSEPLNRWYTVTAYSDEPGHFAVLFRDITAQKEKQLQESEQRHRLLIDHAGEAIVVIQDGFVQFANSATVQLFGYSEEQLYSVPFTEYLHAEDHELAIEEYTKALSGSTVTPNYTLRIITEKGSIRWIEFNAVQIDWDNRPAVLGFARDITKRKQAEEELRKSEERYRLLAENASDIIWINDLDLNYIYISPSVERILGYSAEELLLLPAYKTHTPSSQERAKRVLQEELAKEQLEQTQPERTRLLELEHICKDGSTVTLEAKMSFLRDQEGRPNGILGITRDISDRKRAEEALRKSEARVRSKLSSILSPQGGLDNLKLAEIIDVDALQSMMNDFYSLTRIGIGIIDLEGTVLVSTGWQDICTKFHRVHPETARHCLESDTYLAQDVTPGTFKLYKCKNNMWDIATPLFIGDKHVGNLFLGQFFFEDEAIDYELFRSQAQKYGFNEKEYIDALEQVPRFSRFTLNTVMDFYTKFANMTSLLSYSNLELARLLSERDAMIRKLKKAEQKLADYTQELEQLYGYLDQEISKAQQVHEQILPQSLFTIENISLAAYYQPAEKMGGDFYDLIHCGNKLIFYLSDVSGHGMDGAMLSLFVKHTVNSYIDLTPAEAIKPKAVLKYLAEKFCQETFPEELYIAIFLAALDLETMELTYIGAGFQESPIVRLGEGEQLELVSKGIVISRIFPLDALNLDQDSVKLSPGSTIFFTTDGLTEQGSPGAYYMDRLPDLFYANAHLSPELIKQIVVEDFRSFNGGSQQGEDDITFLVLQVDPPEKEVYRFELASDFTELSRLRKEVISFDSDTDKLEEFLIGMHELVNNAIEHGNRLDPGKPVVVEIVLSEKYIQATVEDQGEGFNWREKINRPLELSGNQERGLGIAMTRLSSDHLVYNEKGNQATFVVAIHEG